MRRRRTSAGHQVVIAVLVVLLAACASYALVGRSSAAGAGVDAASESAAGDVAPRIVSEGELRAYGDRNGPVYWAGAASGRQYELTASAAGTVYVRYLPEGVAAGSPETFLTVATYHQPGAGSMLGAAAVEQGTSSWTTGSGALVAVRASSPSSTWFSFPGAAFQVEAFSPVEGESRGLVVDGAVELLGAAG